MDSIAADPPAPAPLDFGSRRPGVLSFLSALHEVLGASRAGRSVLRALRVRRLAREWLRTAVLPLELDRPDAVTVLIGVRNRNDHRLALALRSIREQSYPADLIGILVVDYGSARPAAELTAQICAERGAHYIGTDSPGVWSRSRCLNIGIRRTVTKYLLTSDIDILFSPDYIARAVEAIHRNPLSLICSSMLDLPEESVPLLRESYQAGRPLNLREWRKSCTPRLGRESHPSITLTFTVFHQLIRGYDEFYELWGKEDVDLLRRMTKLGLDQQVLRSADAFYIHQWHPKYEGIPDERRERAVERNVEYLRRTKTIVRNGPEWGTGRGRG